MAGFKKKDFKETFILLNEFKPEPGVDRVRTPFQQVVDLADVSGNVIDIDTKLEELERATEGHEHAV